MASKKRIGHYQIEAKLDSAGGLPVYLVYDSESGRNLGLEQIAVAGGDKAEREQSRLLNWVKARQATKLCHTHIVRAFDVIEEDGDLWVAYEPFKAESLENLVCTATSVDKDLISHILYHTAACLDYAHQLGIHHGSLSPAELLVREDNDLRINGFWRPALSSSGSISAFDKTHYASPEQIRGLHAGAASDQYSLAAVAHELLTGKTPFQGDAVAVRNRIVLDRPQNPLESNPSLGEDAAAVLLRGLEKSPASRFKSCTEFVQALNNSLESVPGWGLPEEYHGREAGPTPQIAMGSLQGEVTETLLREVLASRSTGPGNLKRAFAYSGKFVRPLAIAAAGILIAIGLVGWGLGYVSNGSTSEKLRVEAVSPPAVVMNQPYLFSLRARGGQGPYEWSLVEGQLPAGLTLEPQGMIRGQSGAAGVYSVRVQVREANSQSPAVTEQISLTVKQGPRITSSEAITGGLVGREYVFGLGVEGGQRPYRWAVAGGSLPPGVSLNGFSGFLGGRPDTAGAYRFAISVTDLFGATSTREFEMTVESATKSGAGERIAQALADFAPLSNQAASGGGTP